jgi:hypothetical protein
VDQPPAPIEVACGLAEIGFDLWCRRRECVALDGATAITPLSRSPR